MNLHHISIKAPQDLLIQERDFFCEILGLEEAYRPDLSSKGYWLYSGEKPLVHLSESEQHFKNEQQGFFDHVAFQSTGLKEFIHLLEAKGVEYRISYQAATTVSQVFVNSPSATKIEVSFKNERITNSAG